MKCLVKEAFKNESEDVKCEILEEAKALCKLSIALEGQSDSTPGVLKELSTPSWQL